MNNSKSRRCRWTAIVLTCQNIENAQSFQTELNLRRDRGDIDRDVILLTVEDPKLQVGSGGATLNALLVVAEHISAKTGYTVVNSDVLDKSLILIVHMGRFFPFDPCGRAFVSVPLVSDNSGETCNSLVCNFDLLLETMTSKFAANSQNGVWVCSSDMFLKISEDIVTGAFDGADAVVIAVPGTLDYAQNHGIYKISAEGEVENIVYQCKSLDVMREFILSSGDVALVSGVVYLSVRVAERLLACHVMPPLSSCTYFGQDSGTLPIQLSLFFDFMLAMCSQVSEDTFVAGGVWAGERGTAGTGSGDSDRHAAIAARRLIWRQLSKFKVKALLLKGQHSYMDFQPLTHYRHLLWPVQESPRWSFRRCCHSFLKTGSDVPESSILINSIIGKNVKVGSSSVISHCHLATALEIGCNSMLHDIALDDATILDAKLKDEIAVYAYRIFLPMLDQHAPQRVFIVFGMKDNLQNHRTFCNDEFSLFLRRTGISITDLWDSSIPEERRTLLNARLFSVLNLRTKIGFDEVLWLQGSESSAASNMNMLERWKSSWRLSIVEILPLLDVSGHFNFRKKLFFDVATEIIRDSLVNCRNYGLNRIFRSAVNEGFAEKILEVLDNVGSEEKSPGIAARTLASIAEVLGAMSKGDGGLRSGPASNLLWQSAFQLLEQEEISAGFRAMANERANWLVLPSHMIRAARHYEGAAQILIRHAVMSARNFIKTTVCEPVAIDKWVTVDCPARIDIAGGWSDTPPITYEHGGAVLDAAVKVDGRRPIGAKVRRIANLQLVLHIENDEIVTITELSSLKDYNQPHSPGALLKAAMLCSEIVQYPSESTLAQQLFEKHGGGFEVYTWSNLPHGSGLGTSSILAGAIMAALWKSSGKAFDISSLNHAVLHLEQLLTTGGGWQDQVGGLTPGIKVGHSRAELPLKIEVTFLKMTPETIKAFNDRLLLVYTGKTRLARNLLQNVVRNWYSRNPEIVDTKDRLVANVWTCAQAFENGDLEAVGKCLSEYWQQKKVMAPGCEPEAVGRMMDALRPHTYGMSMAGAGGGGFLYLLMKEPKSVDAVRKIFASVQGTENAEVYDACVDEVGLELTVEDCGAVKVPLMFDG